jgi:hypothetical protein
LVVALTAAMYYNATDRVLFVNDRSIRQAVLPVNGKLAGSSCITPMPGKETAKQDALLK